MRIPDHRSQDPMAQPRGWLDRRAGAKDQRDTDQSLVGVERYTDRAILQAQAIAWEAPFAGGDQAITTTTYTVVTGSDFRISLGNINGGGWLVWVTYRVVIQSMDAVDSDVHLATLVDWQDTGTWVRPDVDRDTTHGLAQAFSIVDYAEAAVAASAFSLQSPAVFRVRGGGTVGIAAGIRVGSGQTANINLTTTDRPPECVGFALPCLAL